MKLAPPIRRAKPRAKPRRRDRFERQADTAAASALRSGERRAAKYLTAAPVARAPEHVARGEPLVADVRLLLEERFGADLRAVRIHTDASAGRAALHEDARAFAAGADIYFAPGVYDPTTPSGLAVIAHEVAHVLQQTGRRDGDVMRASARSGDADVQRLPLVLPPGTKVGELDRMAGQNMGLLDAISDFRAHFSGDKDLESTTDWVQSQVERFDKGVFTTTITGTSPAVYWGLKSQIDDATSAAGSPASRAFIVHILAMADQGGPGAVFWELAAKILAADKANELVTRDTSTVAPFKKWLRDTKGDEYFAGALEHPRVRDWWHDLKVAYTELVADPRRIDMFPALRDLGGTDPTSGTKRTLIEQEQAIDKDLSSQHFVINERAYHALELLVKLDAERFTNQADWLTKIGKPEDVKFMDALVKVQHIAAAMHAHVKSVDKLHAPHKEIAEHIRDVGATMEAFWTDAINRREETKNFTWPTPAPRDIDDILQDLEGAQLATDLDPIELKPFGDMLEKHAAVLFADPAGAPPAIETYRAAVAALDGALTRTIHEHVTNLMEALRVDPKAKTTPTFRWILAWSHLLRLAIKTNEYKPQDDYQDFHASGGTVTRFDDRRRWHRSYLARKLLETAVYADFTTLQKLSADMLDGDSQSRLFLFGHWKQADDDLSQISVDLKGSLQQPINWKVDETSDRFTTGIPLEQIVTFFHLLKLQTVNDGLDEVLAKFRKEEITRKSKLDTNEILKNVAKLPRPRRWDTPADGHIFMLRGSDREESNRNPARRALILQHPKTKAELPSDKAAITVLPTDLGKPALFCWVVPDIQPMVDFIRGLPITVGEQTTSLDLLIKGETGEDAPADANHWIEAFEKVDKEKVSGVIESLLFTSERGLDNERAKIATRTIELSAIHRRIQQKRLEFFLDALDNRSKGGADVSLTYPAEVIRTIYAYQAYGTAPRSHADVQRDALVLSVGAKLDSAFDDEIDSMPASLYPLLHFAVSTAKQQRMGRPPDITPDVSDDYEPPQPILEDVLDVNGGETVDSLLEGQSGIEALIGRFEMYLGMIQAEHGFATSSGGLKAIPYGKVFAVNEEFTWENRVYQLRAIHKDFAFRPAPTKEVKPRLNDGVGKDAGEISMDEAVPLFTIDIDDSQNPFDTPSAFTYGLDGPKSGGITPQRAAIRKKALEAAGNEEERKALEAQHGEELDAEKETGRYLVTSADTELLAVIAHAVELAAMNEGLQQTAEIMAAFQDAVITTLEIILPGGQAIMWTELVASVALTLDDPGIKDLIKTIQDDPSKLFDIIKDKLASLGDPDLIWSMLFDGGPSIFDVFGAMKDAYDSVKGGNRAPRAPARGRLGRIVRFIVSLGKRLFKAFAKLKNAVRGPIAATRAQIITRPRVAWMLARAADWVGGFNVDLENIGMTVEEFKEIGGDIREHIVGLAKVLNELELPGEIVPIEDILSMLISFIISKIPKVKIIRPVLEAVGWIDRLAEYITKEAGIRGSPFDPNEAWKALLQETIAPYFKTLKKDLIVGVFSAVNMAARGLNNLSFLGIDVPQDGDLETLFVGKEDDDVAADVQLVDSEEIQPYPSEDAPATPPLAIPRDSGRPLADGDHAAARTHFGQDFGHVRVHDDVSAARFTSSIGAEAATSGSHVFLGDGAARSPDRSREVLHHELAHVVQQTGTRSLGANHDNTPVRGEASRGLNIDPAHEGAADRAAQSASAGTGPRASGVQPMLADDVLYNVLSQLTEFKEDGGQFKALTATEDEHTEERALAIWDSLKTKLEHFTFARFLSKPDVKTAVKERVTDGPIGKQDIKGVAAMAERKVPGKTTPQGKDVKELRPRRFVSLLEGYIYARTGVAMQIKAGATGDIEQASSHVTHLNLPFVKYQGTGAVLIWDRVLESLGPTGPIIKTTERKDVIRAQLRAFLGRLVPIHPSVFALGDDLRIAPLLVQKFREEVVETGGRPGTVSPIKEYANPNPSAQPLQMGLMVSVHGLMKDAKPEKVNRESHHLPQFLLLEFFRNRHENKNAFPEPRESYAAQIGLTPAKGHIDTLKVGGATFDLGKLDEGDGRGNKLPAVLLAAETHRRGALHVDDFKDEEVDNGPQSSKLDTIWHNRLPDELKVRTADNWAKQLADTAVQGKLLKAIRDTYSWMYTRMIRGLASGLKVHEVAYYEELVGKLHPGSEGTVDYTMTEKHIQTVLDAIEAKNNELMKPWRG